MIQQFYATVYVSPDFYSLVWMTRTQRVEAIKTDFEQASYLGSQEKVYSRGALQTPAWCNFYDGNVRYTPRKITGLLPLPSLINQIINHTFFPKSGNFDAIRGHAWNIIDYIMKGRKFDVVDLIIREIASSKKDRAKWTIYYGSYHEEDPFLWSTTGNSQGI